MEEEHESHPKDSLISFCRYSSTGGQPSIYCNCSRFSAGHSSGRDFPPPAPSASHLLIAASAASPQSNAGFLSSPSTNSMKLRFSSAMKLDEMALWGVFKVSDTV